MPHRSILSDYEEEENESENYLNYPVAKAVSMNRLQCFNTSLKDWYIPIHSLPNRTRPLSRNKSNMYHTLEKRNCESFSTFEDSEENRKYLKLQFFTSSSDSLDSAKKNDQNKPQDISNKTDSVQNLETHDIETHSMKESLDVETPKVETEQFFLEDIPIPYRKHTVPQIPSTKRKQPKDKRKKKAANTIQLGDYLQTPNEGEEIPKRDFFYEGLVRQGKAPPLNSPIYNKPSDLELFNATNMNGPLTHSSLEVISLAQQNIYSEHIFENAPSTDNEELFNEDDITTLVLENLPSSFNEESIEQLLDMYGEIRKISLEKKGNHIKAHIKIILKNDIEWTIGILNGSELFGDSKELLKCYQAD